MRSADYASWFRVLLPALALLAVLALRWHGLAQVALPDYDSVRNWQIVQEVAHGNLRNLFHHGSPGFSLLYAPLAWLSTDFRVFQYLNAVVAVAALAVLGQFVAHERHLQPWETALLLLFTGTSVFLTFSGRDFTMGSASLLAFAGLLGAHFRRLRQPSRAALLRAAAWLALGLSINYKFLLTLPILLVLELWTTDGLLWLRANLMRVLLVLAAPYVLLGALGVAGGLPWHRWPAVYFNILWPGASNAAGRNGFLGSDWLYYLRYLWQFESKLVLVGLVAGLGWAVWRGRRGGWWRQRLPLPAYLAGWAACFLLGMSVLLKAPRGLLLAYPLLYVLAFLAVRGGLRLVLAQTRPAAASWLLVAVMLAATAFNLHRIRCEIYAYAPTRYGRVAAWLHADAAGPVRVASTLSLGLAPFLGPTDTLAVVTDERQLAALQARGFRYVLLDAAWRINGVARFDSLRRQPPVAAWPEPLLTAPLLFLEHSEYTGRGYLETLAQQHSARQDSVQLRLYRLGD